MAGPGPNRWYSSVAAQASLNGNINNSTNSMTVSSTTGFPGSFPYTLSINQNEASEELVTVTNASGLVLTILRGQDGTAGVLHSNGASIVHVMSARDMAEPQAHLGAYDAVHGVTGLVVGTTDAQTLSNKTLTSPIISTISNTGTLTLPATTDTLVGRATTDTLTNKTISGGTFTGTIGGTPTYSGPPTFAGGAFIGGGSTLDTSAASPTQPVTGPSLQGYAGSFAGAGFVAGNGTSFAGYVKYGKQVFWEAFFIVGTTTVMGTSLTFNLPVATSNYVSGTGHMVTTSHGAAPLAIQNGSVTGGVVAKMEYYAVSGAVIGYGDITATVPLTVDVGTVFYAKGTYQATS